MRSRKQTFLQSRCDQFFTESGPQKYPKRLDDLKCNQNRVIEFQNDHPGFGDSGKGRKFLI